MRTCPRCRKPFKPEAPAQLCCFPCQFRNLCDGLDLPTPPEMLDEHTKHPTLTKEEFNRRMAQDDPIDQSAANTPTEDL